jgi:hypothetical protein
MLDPSLAQTARDDPDLANLYDQESFLKWTGAREGNKATGTPSSPLTNSSHEAP